jgi:hypothetical protein
MNQQITLTTMEKIMNMAKLGMVSRRGGVSHCPILSSKNNNMNVTCYTLCEI